MTKDHGNDHFQEQSEDILDAILGPDQDLLESENCEAFLLALGIDPTNLLSELKDCLEERARHHQSESGAVPNTIVGALRVVRERLKSSNPMNANPTSHIDLLLSGGLSHQHAGIARAFRRESDDELCSEDQELLDDLEAELGGDQDPGK